MPQIIPPRPDADDQYFWDGVARDELLLQRCAACGRLRQPPSPMCAACASLDWDTQPASGRATVYSWIASTHPTETDEHPRVVAVLDLEEGVRFVSNLIDVGLDQIRHGMPVELVFVDYDGTKLPQFRPRKGEGSA